MNNENDHDSSDSDGENYNSDDSGDLSFESDDEGNFAPNPLKQRAAAAVNDDEEDVDGEQASDEYESGDEEDGDVSGEEEIDSDDIEDISDAEGVEEEDDEELSDEIVDDEDEDDEDVPLPSKASTSKSNGVQSHKSEKKSAAATTNGVDAAASEAPKEVERVKPAADGQPNAVAAFKNELNKADKKKGKGEGQEKDEYADHDTSDEEDIRNTVGNIPMQWYDEYKHIGYDWDAKKIIKPPQRDQLDDFLKRMEDPNFWRTVKDPLTGQDVILSEADIELIKRINEKRIPDANYDEYAVSVTHSHAFHSIFSISINSSLRSHGSIGSHPKWRKCPFAMCPTTNAPSFHPNRRRRRCRVWCTPSKWAGSKPKRKKKRNGSRRDRNSICCGKRTPAKKICVVFTITCRHQNAICPATPNPTIHHQNICSTSAKNANGTNTKTNHPGANCTFCHRNSIRCARCRCTSAMYANVFYVVSICICVRVQSV